MQIASATSLAAAPQVLASQSIDTVVRSYPHGGVTQWSTERQYRLAGAATGLDTFSSLYDAVTAARTLSAGEMPGLAVVKFRGGYRVHDVHTSSRTYVSTSTHGPFQPSTRLTKSSSVPFAAGNLRLDAQGGRNNPAVVRADELVALIDGERVFVPGTVKWAGKPQLVETRDY
ncbi:MAG: hypothetical protein JWM86_1796 [Thermoleophilia bacterium]|nr:hypothetical protein [Thermoleophilia bacterium]